jgi:hypothetical protein
MRVIKASDRVYAKHLLGLKPDLAAFGLCILPQLRFLRVAEMMLTLSPDYPIEDSLAQLTVAQSSPQILDGFVKTLELLATATEEQSSPATNSVVKLLGESLRLAPGPLKSRIQAAIRRDPALASAGLDGGLSISDIGRLSVEVIRELLDPYDTESLAKLLISVNQNLVGTFVAALSNKVRIATESEYNRLNSNELLRKRSAVAGEAIQEEILANLSQLIAEGVVSLRSAEPTRNVQVKAS